MTAGFRLHAPLFKENRRLGTGMFLLALTPLIEETILASLKLSSRLPIRLLTASRYGNPNGGQMC